VSRRADGFTLLEIMIAIAVTALLVTVAVQSHIQIERAQERARLGLDRDRAAFVFLDRLSRELESALLVVKPQDRAREEHPYLFFGVDASDAGYEADGVRFVTGAPSRAARASAPVGPRLVSYGALPSDDPEAGLLLLREEQRIPAALEKLTTWDRGQVVLEDMVEFRVRYRAQDGEWLDAWDSTAEATPDAMPLEIEVLLRLYEPGEAGEPREGREHLRVVQVRTAPIYPRGHAAGDEGGGTDPNGAGCVTMGECLERFADLLDGLDDEGFFRLEDELLERGDDACFEGGTFLGQMIRTFGGDVAECTR
jgi:general secretion pathway protein J